MSKYEFTEPQNEVIAGVSRKLKLAGVLLAVLGFLTFGTSVLAVVIAVARPSALVALAAPAPQAEPTPVAQIQPTVAPSPQAAVTGMMVTAAISLLVAAIYLLMARWNQSAGRSFEAITTTRGNDIPLLLHALDRLAEIYRLQRNLFIACFVLGAALIVGGMVLALVVVSVM